MYMCVCVYIADGVPLDARIASGGRLWAKVSLIFPEWKRWNGIGTTWIFPLEKTAHAVLTHSYNVIFFIKLWKTERADKKKINFCCLKKLNITV